MAVNTFSTPNSALNASNYQLPAFGDSDYAYWEGSQGYNAGSDFVDWFTGVNSAAKDRYNVAQSALDRQFQIDYDSTKYQRAASDLKAAGLNPWLALGGGVSASSASASGSKGHFAPDQKKMDVTGGLSSALKILGFLTIKSAFASASKPNVSLELDSIDKRNVLNSLMSSSGSPGGSAKSWEEMLDILAPGGGSSKGWDL